MDKDRSPRLIIDVTARSGRVDAKRLFEALRVAIIEPRPLAPALLLLTRSQYDELPRSFDKHGEWLRVEVVDEAEAPVSVAALASAGALVASFRRYSPPDHWLAMELDLRAGKLLLMPADGLARFAREGSLPLPTVGHDLAQFVGNVPIPPFDADGLGPLEQRRLMVELGLEDRAEQVSPDPARRLAMARALGVAAAATQRDRVAAEVREAAAGLGAVGGIASMPEAKLNELLARAHRRRQSPTMVLVGDQIEVINPGKDQPGLDHPRVRVHRIEAPEPALTRLQAAVSGWTLGDFEADPFLDRLIARLDPGGRERLALLHARAVLLHGPFSPPEGPDVEDWRAALARLLAHDVPPAKLLLPVRPFENSRHVTVEAPRWVGSALQRVQEHDASALRSPPSALDEAVPVGRDEAVSIAKRDGNTSIRLPDGEGAPSPDAGDRWLDAFEDWIARSQRRGQDAFDHWTAGHQRRDHCLPALETTPIESLPWQEADRHLGLIWLALRQALRSAPAIRLHDGRALLPISDGLAAQVSVCEVAEPLPLPLQAFLDAKLEHYSRGQPARCALALGVPGGVASITLSIPSRVVLLGEQMRAEVEFLGSALFFGASGRAVIHAAELARQEQEEDERRRAEEQARYDDD